jgi:hypothetical protein
MNIAGLFANFTGFRQDSTVTATGSDGTLTGITYSTRLPAQADRGIYVVWILAIWALVLFGFGSDFVRYLHEAPQPPLILHIHAAVAVVWLALVSTQILLVEGGNIRLHRRFGWATIGVAAAMVPLGFTAAMVDMARQVTHADYAPQFLAEEFQDILAFAVCTVAGIVTRKNRAEHARFMVLAAVALLDVGPGRIASNLIGAMPTGPFGVWAQFYWGTALILIAMLAWDLIKHGRVMRSVALGAVLLWTGEAIASILYFSPAWKLAAARLVNAWSWAG